MDATEKASEFEFIKGLTAELSAKELIFPTSLNATMKIRHALDNPDISNDTVARIIGAEPVLSAQVLRLSNSVIFNPQGKKISDLRTATLLLGFSAVKNIAISVGMKQLAENKHSGILSDHMEGLWKRSLRVAALSMVIAKNLSKLSPDRAMLAGLLHDIGKFYILNRAHHYQSLFVSEQTLWELVDQWSAGIGAAILENWEISDDIRDAVMEHRNVNHPLSSRPDLTDVVATADFLDAHVVDESLPELDWDKAPNALRNLQLDKEKCLDLMQETRVELALVLKAIS